jgi:hypothetical protein
MINFSAPITDLDGNPRMRPEGAALVPATLGWLCRAALAADVAAEAAQGGDQKIKRIELAMKIPREGQAELSAAEITAVCKRVGQVMGAVETYRATELLDPTFLKGSA